MSGPASPLDAVDDGFLGVERSASGKRWRRRLGDDRAGLGLAQRLQVPELVGRVLAARGVTADGAEDFLNPTLKVLLPDPSRLRDMDRAAERIAAAVMAGERIAVFGDYDVDGATSSALLHRFIEAAGGPAPRIYIPDRMAEGYGPNAPALRALAGEGVRLVVTVDCGTTAHEPLAAAADAGLEIIVVDHHVAEPHLPDAFAVINPNRLDDGSNSGQLAAVGVAFLLVVAVNRRLRHAGWFTAARAAPDLMQWLDLVALGTVCDVVPLTGVNRALVTQGLKIMSRRQNVGLTALLDIAGLDEPPGTYHAGFLVGPRVNAGGRVGEAGLGAEILSTEDPAAAEMARRLDGYNTERRAIEATVLDQALAQVADAADEGPLILAAAADWHPGVIGIVASRLKDRHDRPACVVSLADGIGKGSGRSVPGIDLGAAVIAARQADLLVNGGGHAMAAGFTVRESDLPALREFLTERIAAQCPPGGLVPSLGFDGAVTVGGATLDLVGDLERVGPFGAGNVEPRFAVPSARIVRADVVGRDHVRCVVTDQGGGRLKAIAFRAADTPRGEALLQAAGQPLHIGGRLRRDTWQDREDVQLIVDDVARADAAP